jgi:hypothetical protein
MWLEPMKVSHGATILLYFAWLLSFPMWGWCGWTSLPPIPAYKLWLTGEGSEPSDRCHPILLHCTGQHGFRLAFWGCEAPGSGYPPRCWPPGSLVDGISYGEARLYQGELIWCQSDHGDYACFYGGVAMSSSDGTNSSTWVPIVKCAWAPASMSCCAWH